MTGRRGWAAALLIVLGGCVGSRAPVPSCAESNDDHPRAVEYQQMLDEAVLGHLPGAIALIRDADGVWAGASGQVDLAFNTPAQTCHRMPLGSLTKTLTAALVLRLVDEGHLSLDEPIADLLPSEVRDAVANSEQITLRMLLNHTSGVPGYSDQQWYLDGINNPGGAPTQLDALAAVRGGSDFPPGSQHDYSSSNYIVAGLVVEHVMGRPLERVLQDELLTPLGMSATRYSSALPYSDIATGYLDLYGDGSFIESNHDNFLGNTPRSPSAGASADVRDLQRLVDALFRSRSFLSEESASEMTTLAEGSDEPKHFAAGYGLGIVRYEWPEASAWGHTGSLLGFESYAYYVPEDDVTLVLLVNASSLSDGTDNQSVHAYLHHDVLPALRRVALGR